MIGYRYNRRLIDDYLNKGYWDLALNADHCDRNARMFPVNEALFDGRSRLSWRDVGLMSDQLALGLHELGFKRDDVLLIQLPNSVELYLLMIAGEKAGITIVTVQPTFRQNEISALLKHCDARGIILPYIFRNFNYFDMVGQVRSELPDLEWIIITGDEIPDGAVAFDSLFKLGGERQTSAIDLKETKFKPYELTRIGTTSGTTGIPKCAAWETAAVMLPAKNLVRRWEISQDDVIGAVYNIMGGGISYLSIYGAPIVGAKVVLLDRFTPEGFCKLVEKEKITIAGIVPTQTARLLEFPDLEKYDLRSLRILAHSTTTLPYGLAVNAEEKLGVRYMQTYGTMDCGPLCSTAFGDPQEVRLKTVGRPYDGNEIKIVNHKGKEVHPGEMGEVLVKGPTCGSGYYKNPQLNEQYWRNSWFHTSNEGSLDERGNLLLMGRRRDTIIRGGQNIYPKEIEDCLNQHPKISQVAIVRMPDRIMGEKACAFIVLKQGENMTFEEMVAFLKLRNLAPFKLPERLEIRDKLPLVPAGQKVNVIHLEEEIAHKLESEINGWYKNKTFN